MRPGKVDHDKHHSQLKEEYWDVARSQSGLLDTEHVQDIIRVLLMIGSLVQSENVVDSQLSSRSYEQEKQDPNWFAQ